MPAFFPTPYPDEILYSVIARCAAWRRPKSLKRFASLYFGSGYPRATVDLPNRLDTLVARIPDGSSLTAEQLIENNTLFPLYRPFLTRERADRVVEMMRGDKSGFTIHGTIGLKGIAMMASRFLRYCPKCVSADEKEYGEPYWHRVHQIFGVRVCPTHETWLEESTVPISPTHTRHAFFALGENTIRKNEGVHVAPAREDLFRHLAVAKGALELLNGKYPSYGPRELQMMYIGHLREKGLASASGIVRQPDLVSAF